MVQIKVNAHSEAAGYFIFSTDKRGEIASFPNLITNGGLDRMGANSDWLMWCQVGSGSATPNVNDSSLGNRIAGTNSTSSNTNGAQSSEPYFTWRRKTFRFAAGVAAGNLSEVGVGWASTGSLFSRALILDAQGAPTTITVQGDETLDVTYEFRLYPKTTDDTGQVTLTGNIGGTYDWVFRAANVTVSGGGGWDISINGSAMNQPPGSGAWVQFREGVIGGITGTPSGSSSTAGLSVAGYSAGSHEIQFTLSAGLTSANFATGVGAAWLSVGIPAFQIGFTPKIPKTSDDIISIVLKHSWARRP